MQDKVRGKLDYRTTVLISGRQRKVWHFFILTLGGTGWYLVVLGQQKAVLGKYKVVRAESIWVSG